MVTLISTPASANANAYADVTVGGSYLLENRLFVTKWVAATADEKASALIWATFVLDIAFDWFGTKRTTDQALRFPRSGIQDADSRWLNYDTIPRLLEKATAELALFLLTTNRVADPGLLGKGISALSVGPISITVSPEAVFQLIPDYIVLMLSPLGEPKPGALGGAGGVVKLVRA